MAEVLSELAASLSGRKPSGHRDISAYLPGHTGRWRRCRFHYAGLRGARIRGAVRGQCEALPLLTQAIVGLGDLVSEWGWLLLILLAAAGLVDSSVSSDSRGREWIDLRA